MTHTIAVLSNSLPSNIKVIERGWLSANQVYIHDNNFVDIVDSGFCLHAQQTVHLLKSYLDSLPSLLPRNLINTHLHSDHCGGNQALQVSFNLNCLVPESEFNSVNNWPLAETEFKNLGQPCPRFRADGFVSVGKIIKIGSYDFEVHGSPGHHPFSILLYAPTLKLLISADSLWGNGFGALFSQITHGTGFIDQRSSLDKISTLDIDLVIPGHGSPFSDVKAALSVAYSRLDYFESNPVKNIQHIAQVLFQFMVMFKVKLSIVESLEWCKETPLFAKCAVILNKSIEELFHETIKQLQSKNSLEFNQDSIFYKYKLKSFMCFE